MSSVTGLGIREKAKGSFGSKNKDGKPKESWRGDFKGVGQVAGWMGKGKTTTDAGGDHVSRPLHTLKDPSSFGPPPKNVNYHGGAALPNQITPDRRGLGAPLSREELQAKQEAEEEEAQREAEEEARSRAPAIPFRADTSGLSTAHLPPPPGRKDGADGRSATPPVKGKPPGLPPRLPPRQNSSPMPSPSPTHDSSAAAEPDSHRGILNQGSLNKLGAAGISVPGLGIGTKGRQLLPAPAPTSPTRSPAPAPASGSNPQLNELQSRFSRLSSSASPKSDSPSQGTTFSQKQEALRTASSFRNDPSSVSFSDAKNAASTANNFRERHGEQVKSGWQSANKLNTKYGISDKVGAFGGGQSQEPVVNHQIEMKDNTNHAPAALSPQIGVAGKKKPPPPPTKRADLAGSSVGRDTGAPPPIPLSSKPKPTPSRAFNDNTSDMHQTQDLDLDLKSLWFAKSPAILPPSIIGPRGRKTHASSSGWSSTGARKTHTYNAIVQDNSTLGRTKINLTWDASNPGVTIKAQQKQIPPPRKLSQRELENYRQSYSEAVATWCESNMGRQVGDGECWTLANEGLKAVAANCNSYGTEPCMSSQSLIHGAVIYTFAPAVSPFPEPRGGVLEAGVARGDVIQILKGIFKSKDGMRQAYAGDPDHTAVVTSVEPDGVLRVVQSNVGGSRNVAEGSYDMSELVKGEVRIFRAVGESWLGKMDPTW